jgi:hypothetical protein
MPIARDLLHQEFVIFLIQFNNSATMRSLRHDSLVDTNNMQLKMYDAIKGAWGL